MMKRKFQKKRQFSFLTVFLILDLFIIFATFKTSNASYTSTAIGNTEMDVALYAFTFDGVKESDSVDATYGGQTLDINLGDIAPGDSKYYKFQVYNSDGQGHAADTNISYELKIITTTNINLEYELYVNQSAYSTNKASLIDSSQLDDQISTDDFGTYYRIFTIPERCFKYGVEKFDEYTLKVTFPKEYSNSSYQDLVESVKIQLVSKQVLPGDDASNNNICR